MSDCELGQVRQAASGDHDALSALLKGHAKPLRRRLAGKIPACWRSVLCEEDVLQQTFADAFRGIHRFAPDGEGSFGAWLTTLARRNLADALRRLSAEKRGGNRRRVELASGEDTVDLLVEVLTSSGTSPSRHAARDEARAALKRAISRLPHDYRAVVEMFDLAGESPETVARKLNRRRGAMYMLRARAHDWLSDLLGAEGDFFTDTPSASTD